MSAIDNRMIRFTEFISTKPKQQAKAETYYINPDHVGLISPRTNYTSMLVQGYWIHVNESHYQVLSKLGRLPR